MLSFFFCLYFLFLKKLLIKSGLTIIKTTDVKTKYKNQPFGYFSFLLLRKCIVIYWLKMSYSHFIEQINYDNAILYKLKIVLDLNKFL